MAQGKPIVAYFGATGGCTLAALCPALEAGYDCTALVRTPAKLIEMLLGKGVAQSNIDSHLIITQGDVLNVDDCKNALTHNGRSMDMIICGVGAYPKPGSPQITLCADAANNIFSALRALSPPKKPFFVTLSSTGITSAGPRDVPLLFYPMYHYLLTNPHKDKKNLEATVIENARSTNSAISGYVLIRPSLLTNGKALGAQKIRVGSEEKPEIGYTISRNDVGLWMFENLVRGERSQYSGQKPSLTY